MPQTEPKVITRKQAKRQINTLCTGLVVFVLLESLLRIGKPYLLDMIHVQVNGVSTDVVFMIAEVMIMAVCTIPFIFASNRLELKMADYMHSPHYRFMHMLSLICIGIALRLLTASLSQLFYFFAERPAAEYEWFGNFTNNTYIINHVCYLIVFIILRPVFSEFIFRGIIQRQLGHYGRYFGVLGSAFLYGLCQADLPNALAMFVLGWYLSTVTLYAHSIVPAIRISIFLNLFLWCMYMIPARFYIPLLALIIAIYILSALYLFSMRRRNLIRYGATESTLWKLLVSAPSVIILIILFAANAVFSFLS